ncbi:MAG: HlyD family efflux transporter periplasmic adaptor subunit [bacterium]|nr:HlyD family efflux transporter periplasmic adaptor subunit [bacterium]
MKRIFPLLLIAALGAAGWYWLDHNGHREFPYSGTIEADDASLASKIGGRIEEVLVEEGDAVTAGQPLIRLDRGPAQAALDEARAAHQTAIHRLEELEHGSRPQEIDAARAQLLQAQARWREMKNGPRKEEIDAARANVEAAEAKLKLAQRTEKRIRDLQATQAASREQLDQAEEQLDAAQSGLRASQAQLTLLLNGYREEDVQQAAAAVDAASAALSLAVEGPRPEQIAQARAEVARASATVDRLRFDLDEKEINAPGEGVVEVSRLERGDLLAPNQTALTVLLYQPLWVRIYAPESRLGSFQVGEEIKLAVNAYPGETFTGNVIQINRQAEFTPRNVQTPDTRDDLVFGVKIEIQDPDHRLRPGMVADARLASEGARP